MSGRKGGRGRRSVQVGRWKGGGGWIGDWNKGSEISEQRHAVSHFFHFWIFLSGMENCITQFKCHLGPNKIKCLPILPFQVEFDLSAYPHKL